MVRGVNADELVDGAPVEAPTGICGTIANAKATTLAMVPSLAIEEIRLNVMRLLCVLRSRSTVDPSVSRQVIHARPLAAERRSSWTGSCPIVRSSSPSSCASSSPVARALDERSAEVGPTRISNSMPSPHLWRKASMVPGSLANPHRQHPIGPSSTHDRHAGIEREDHTIDLVGRVRHCEQDVEPQGALPSARSRCDNA